MKAKIRQLILDPAMVNHKTALMKYLELVHGQSIEVLLMEGGLRKVARKLGIDDSTVWRWRQALGLPNKGRD